jgi:hypothetical protein
VEIHIAGRQTGKMFSQIAWMEEHPEYVMLCGSAERRDALRGQYPHIDPTRFVFHPPQERPISEDDLIASDMHFGNITDERWENHG